MKKFLFNIFALILSISSFGQVFPLSDYYILNPLIINPAYAGSNGALDITLSYRNQWVGFKDAPKYQTFTVHSPVNNNKIGLGLLIENCSYGIYKETNIIGNYAYRVEVFDGRLAMGLGFGLVIYGISWNDLKANDTDDGHLVNNSLSAILPNFSLGTFYYTKKYFLGFSLPLFLIHEIDSQTGEYKVKNDFSAYNYMFSGGYHFNISRTFEVFPSFLLKYNPNSTIQIDYTSQFILKDKFGFGLGYRNKDILIGLVQCQVTPQLKLAYSYDYDFSSIGKYMNGSHEIVVNYLFSYRRKIKGPRHF